MLRFHNYDDLFIFILTTNTNPAVLRTSDGSIAFSLLQNTTLFNTTELSWVYSKFSLLSQFAVTFCGCFFHFCLDTKVEQKIKAA